VHNFALYFFLFLGFLVLLGFIGSVGIQGRRWKITNRIIQAYSHGIITAMQMGVLMNEMDGVINLKLLQEMEIKVENIISGEDSHI
jgi:hypothetical protein